MIFFFNRALLPFGLQYSLLLTPFFIYYLHEKGFLPKLTLPAIVIGGFSIAHLIIGVVLKDFMVSSILLIALLIFTATFYVFYQRTPHIDLIFKRLAQINLGLTLLAILALATNQLVDVFWYLRPFTAGYKVIPRLKLFELEASHYSLAILPLFSYYFWKVLRDKWKNWTDLLLFLSLVVSLLLSFSLGVIAVIGFSIVVVLLVKAFSFLKDKSMRNTIGLVSLSCLLVLIGLYFFYPDNPLFYRINNLFNGMDTSGRGRTYEAFEIAYKVLQVNNKYLGIGLGQFKIIGRDILIYFYKYSNTPEVARLPNCMAETLVTYGFLGFTLKIIAQFILFFKMKVFQNVFQLTIFIAIFSYQFTGSFLFNGIEYVLWVMAFFPKLNYFNQTNFFNR